MAAPKDYLIAKDLFEHCYFTGPDSKVGEFLQAAEKLGRKVFLRSRPRVRNRLGQVENVSATQSRRRAGLHSGNGHPRPLSAPTQAR